MTVLGFWWLPNLASIGLDFQIMFFVSWVFFFFFLGFQSRFVEIFLGSDLDFLFDGGCLLGGRW